MKKIRKWFLHVSEHCAFYRPKTQFGHFVKGAGERERKYLHAILWGKPLKALKIKK